MRLTQQILLLTLFLFCNQNICTLAQNRSEALVNLGRLASTRVRASSVNGTREQDNVHYGVLNLFDGGEHMHAGLNYTTWITDTAPRHWVRIRFAAPTEIYKIAVEVNNKDAPKAYALELQVQKDKYIDTEIFDSVEMKGFLSVFPMKEPIKNVTEVTITFPGPELIEVSEIRILGRPAKSEEKNKQPTIYEN